MAHENEKASVIEDKPINKEPPDNVPSKTFKEKLYYVKDNITVEPLLAMLIIPSVISRFAMIQLNLDKACRVNFGYPSDVCEALVNKNNNNHTDYENNIQKLISSIDIWKGIITTAFPCIIIIFLGSWSDRTGRRKLCILLPIFGELLTSLNNIVNVYFFYEIPVEITVLLESLFPALTGSWVTMFLGVFSYISDITSEEVRTFRVGLVNFCMTVGLPIGIAMSGVLLKQLGYYGIFSLTAVFSAIGVLYGCFYLPEPDEWLRIRGLPVTIRNSQKNVSFFDLTHVVDTVRVAYRKRPFNRRTKVLLTLLCVFVLFGPSMSEHTIMYLFVRNRLNWDMVKFGFYISGSIILHSFGAMFSITVLSKKLQVDDSVLCLISVASKFVGSVWTAFVTTDLEMYLVPVVEVLNATTFTSLRSIISKLVEKQETAKVNSLFSLVETLASLVFHPFYAWLYMRTLHILAGAVFLTSAGFIIPASAILILFYVQHKKEQRNARKIALEAEEKKDLEKKAVEAYYVPDQETIEKNMI